MAADSENGPVVSFRNVIRDSREGGIDGNAAPRPPLTVRPMSHRRRRLDTRNLRPREYLLNPYQFGHHSPVAAVLPAGGDLTSQRVALVQHELSMRVRQLSGPSTTREVTAEFGFSRSYWNDCLLGKAWMGETMLAAAVSVVLRARP